MIIIPVIQAEETPRIFTDKEVYDETDDVIIVTVENLPASTSTLVVMVSLIHPDGDRNIVYIVQLYYNDDRDFQFNLNMEMLHTDDNRSVMIQDGTYTLTINAQQTFYETTFNIEDTILISEPIPPTITIQTDKTEYYENEIIQVMGEVSEILEAFVTLMIISPDDNIITTNEVTINSDNTFDSVIALDKELMTGTGSYKIRVSYDTSIVEITFEYYDEPEPIPPTITIQSDKSRYYVDELIFINGTMTEIDWSKDTTITYDITYSNNIIESSGGGTLQNNGTFNFTIDSTGWDDDIGSHVIIVTIQNSTADTSVYYNNTPNMSPEALYTMDMQQYEMLEEHDTMMYDQASEIEDVKTEQVSQNETITTQQSDITDIKTDVNEIQSTIDIIWGFLEEWLGQQPPDPLDEPIIISLVADDPDNGDIVYSNDDTLTITFDSPTNEPGGNGVQTKPEIDDLFTFSESIGQAYSGQWITVDIFVITINSVANSEIMLGITTVTPAQITLILPIDNNQENYSHKTSPVMTGNFGETSYSADIQCGRGMELIDGYCFLIK